MFPKIFRLKKTKDIDFLMKRGQKFNSKSFRAFALPSPLSHFRVTVIIGKKCEKSAVKRNLIKRRLRSAIQQTIKTNHPNFPALDLIFWVRHECSADTFDFHVIKPEVENLLSQIIKTSTK